MQGKTERNVHLVQFMISSGLTSIILLIWSQISPVKCALTSLVCQFLRNHASLYKNTQEFDRLNGFDTYTADTCA